MNNLSFSYSLNRPKLSNRFSSTIQRLYYAILGEDSETLV